MTVRKVCCFFSKNIFLLKFSLSDLSFKWMCLDNPYGHSFMQVKPPSTYQELDRLHSYWSCTNIGAICGKQTQKSTKHGD